MNPRRNAPSLLREAAIAVLVLLASCTVCGVVDYAHSQRDANAVEAAPER